MTNPIRRYLDIVRDHLTEVPANQFRQILNESPQIQSGLHILLRVIMDAWIELVLEYLPEEISRYGGKNMDIGDLAAITINRDFYQEHRQRFLKVGFPRIIRQWITEKDYHLRIIADSDHPDGYAGTYRSSEDNHPVIRLYYDDPDDFRKMIKHPTRETVARLLHAQSNTLLHELTHAFDDWRSGGLYQDNRKSLRYNELRKIAAKREIPVDKEKLNRYYLQDPIEINARFQETVANLGFSLSQDWKHYLDDFKTQFDGWDVITPTQRIRVIKRLALEYHRILIYRTRTTDPVPTLTKIQQRLHATWHVNVKFITRTTRDGGNIVMDDFDKASPAGQDAIVKQAAWIADIFRCTLATSEGRPAILKRYGFVSNTGVTQDWNIRERFYRPSRR